MDIIERFLKYVAIDTQSDPNSKTVPSSKKQLKLAKILVEDMKKIGMEDVELDENGYVYGTVKANSDKKLKTIGFISHMDTSPDFSGANVKPNIFKYEGGDIRLNEKYKMSLEEFPFLENLKGLELITTDGNTLLGADDKAGIAEILDAMAYIIQHPEIEHGDIKIGFTPDEEIGRGADLFNIEKFAADFAYTIDGGEIGELEYENFNAATARLKIQGKNVHPGSAKNIMKNALRIGMEFEMNLPACQKPEYTEGYEGFIHLNDMKGSVDYAEMIYIIRDHSKKAFEEKKDLFKKTVDFLNFKYDNTISCDIEDSYYNMREKIEAHMEIVELAKVSMEEIGIKPKIKAIRGGTDGAKLSFMGLPCPNIFAGGMNFHGRYEFIPTEWMRKASALIVKICENAGKNYD